MLTLGGLDNELLGKVSTTPKQSPTALPMT